MKLCVGLDVGGTKIDGCLADIETGEVHATERVPNRASRPGAVVLDECVQLAERLAHGHLLGSVGIGICELVDLAGRIQSATTIDWRELDVCAAFAHLARARLESDVRAAAVAEATFGAGRGHVEPWLYFSVGTGISYVLVQDGRPYTGARGNALIVGAPPVETVASGAALQKAASVRRAEELFDKTGSPDLVRTATTALGAALATLANALDPALIVIGGGLGLNDDYRRAAVVAMRERIEAEATRAVPVVPADLGVLAGPLGAALAGSNAGRSGAEMTWPAPA